MIHLTKLATLKEMMKIEIAKLGRMTQTGSSLMTLYQDKHTPVIDLLVREAVQNSLDAGNLTDEHAINEDFIEVSFDTGDFTPSSLNNELGEATEALNKKFNQSNARFLAIRDKYTVGLTGPMRISDVKNHKYGNLLKLVYDICKPQEGPGSGGSWGIGKTIYFRIGQGLVIYYSRIYDEANRRFQSRLAVSIVEDEHSEDAIIPTAKDNCGTGIAWWGEDAGEGSTVPVTNDEYIKFFLDIFGIEPYKGKETGTTVIVPYINEKELIFNNRTEDSDSSAASPEEVVPLWRRSLDNYLSVAVQRWYFPRLNNTSYYYGKHLICRINGKRITRDDTLPIFRLGQALYNCSVFGKIDPEEEYFESNHIKANVEKIAVRKHFESSTCAGFVAFTEVDKDLLGMCPPTNCSSPYNYLDMDDPEGDSNPPILGYCRKPGMIVSYKGMGKWLYGVPNSEKGKYIVAVFALNSENRLSDIDIELEEYVRKSELANHNSWEDYPVRGKTRDIIAKIKKNTALKLRTAFDVENDTKPEKVNTGLGQRIADLILPKEGFGRKARTKATGIRGNLRFTNHNGISIALLEDETVYNGDSLEASYLVKAKSKRDSVTINFHISSESGAIPPDEWEENGLLLPFEMQRALIRLETIDEERSGVVYSLEKGDNLFDDFLSCKWNNSKKGNHCGISLKFQEEHTFTMTVSFVMKLNSRKVMTIVKLV